jgi:hypothetical protein
LPTGIKQLRGQHLERFADRPQRWMLGTARSCAAASC